MMSKATETLKIDRKQNVETVEKLFAKMYSAESQVDILPSTRLDDVRICGRGDLIMLLLTWGALFQPGNIITHVTDNADQDATAKQLARLFNTEHGFLISRVSEAFSLLPRRQFMTRAGSEIPESVLFQAQNNGRYLDASRPVEKGPRAFICVDNQLESVKDYLPDYSNVYRSRGTGLKARVAFNHLLHSLLEKQPALTRRIYEERKISDEDVRSVFKDAAQIFYELFENSDRWGRRDYGENSIRGCLLHFHYLESPSQKPLSSQVAPDSPLYDFLTGCKNNKGEEDQEYIELSVFDNGPTLAAHYLDRMPTSLQEEYETTIKCLVKSVGRSPYANEGKGLYHVMTLLNELGGFLRIRSGHLSLYRNFQKSELDIPAELNAPKSGRPDESTINAIVKYLWLNDWSSRSQSWRKHPRSVGSLLTLIIPIRGIEK